MLITNGIIAKLYAHFGQIFVFQQDNAPPHSSRYFLNQLPSVLEWPARSPDLIPIEQLWDYIKGKIAGEKLVDADQLFNRLAAEHDTYRTRIIYLTDPQGNVYISEQ